MKYVIRILIAINFTISIIAYADDYEVMIEDKRSIKPAPEPVVTDNWAHMEYTPPNSQSVKPDLNENHNTSSFSNYQIGQNNFSTEELGAYSADPEEKLNFDIALP